LEGKLDTIVAIGKLLLDNPVSGQKIRWKAIINNIIISKVLRLPPVDNFINILGAPFVPIFF
jgi:hypothetical protein